MDPHERFRKSVRGFYAYVVAVVVAVVAPFAAQRLLDTHTAAGRIAGVALGTLAWIPLMLVIATVIREGDEFVRRIHLLAIAIAFAGALVLLSLIDWLVAAGFTEPPMYKVVWVAVAVLWAISLFIAKRYYERPR